MNSYFSETLKEKFQPNRNDDNTPMLNEISLKRHVDEEHEVTKSEISEMIKEKHMQSKGNVFAQLTHHTDTLGNGKKAQSIGLQSLDIF